MKSPIAKLIAAAAVVVIATVGIHRLRSNTMADQANRASSLNPKSGWMPLKIDLPQPVFLGTDEPIRVSNLRKLDMGDRPPFLAPVGTKNVALRKPVAASDQEPIIGEIEMITDGDKEAADGSYVELGPLLQHITIDLESPHEIFAVLVWHYHKQARAYLDVVVQTADDPDFITNVRTLFNNDIDNSAGLGIGTNMHYVETHKGELIDAKGARARYVRLYSSGNSANDLNHYVEVEVYGRPALVMHNTSEQPSDDGSASTELAPLDINLPRQMFISRPRYKGVPNLEEPFGKPRPPFMAPTGTWNVALGKSVSSTDNYPIMGAIEMVTDGRKKGTHRNFVELGPALQSVAIDLGDYYRIYAVVLWHTTMYVRVYYDVVVQVSDDPDFVRNVRTLFNNDIDNSSGFGVGSDMHYVETHEGKLIDASGVKARYVRLCSNGNSANDLNHYTEVEVYGKPAR